MARTDVLLVQTSPVGCQAGVAALLDGRAGVVLADDEADLLPAALAAADAGFAVVSQRVVDEAAVVPTLGPDDLRVLALVGGGASNRVIAHALGTTVGAAKATTARLVRDLGVDGRAGLVELARSLGI